MKLLIEHLKAQNKETLIRAQSDKKTKLSLKRKKVTNYEMRFTSNYDVITRTLDRLKLS